MEDWMRFKGGETQTTADYNRGNNGEENGAHYNPQAHDLLGTDRLFHILFCALGIDRPFLGVDKPGHGAFRDGLSDTFWVVAGDLVDQTGDWLRMRRRRGPA